MSKPRYDWWTYVKGMIRRYPALHAQYIALHETTITAQLTGMPGGGSLSNPTATAALRELSPINQKEHDAVRKAIAETHQYKDGQDRLTIIRLVFWDKSHTLSGAALAVSCSWPTAKRWHRDFIRLVAQYFGLWEEDAANGDI